MNKLYMAAPAELRNINDELDFLPDWSNLTGWNLIPMVIEPRYSNVTAIARVLCLSLDLSKELAVTFWKEKNKPSEGGVVYEYDFNPTAKLTHRQIKYSESPARSPLDYMRTKVKDPKLLRILEKHSPSIEDKQAFLNHSETEEIESYFREHIVEELAFKKAEKFSYEKEYRLITAESPPRNIFSPQELGLTLRSIYTSDPCRIREAYNGVCPVLPI